MRFSILSVLALSSLALAAPQENYSILPVPTGSEGPVPSGTGSLPLPTGSAVPTASESASASPTDGESSTAESTDEPTSSGAATAPSGSATSGNLAPTAGPAAFGLALGVGGAMFFGL